ncbi:MAG: hypothetical protein LUQ11_00825, partial [Methylococcaceae bacterium]|nr:hypothetical protein [Methylococcaceae bacterium]
MRVERPNGQTLIFRPNGTGGWITDSDVNDQLQEGTQWRYTTADKEIEVYDVSGRLQSISDRNGLTQTLSYSDANTPKTIAPYPGLLIQVADQFGRKIQLSYDVNVRITRLTYPDGLFSEYQYDAQGNLSQVTYQDGSIRQYHYEDTAFPHALTGITSENGVRYASWTYDAAGRAASSEHAGSTEKVTLNYKQDGSTTVSEYQNDPKTPSISRIYSFQTILGVVKNTSISQPNPNGSTSSYSSTYDRNGNVASRTDFNGNLACYAYDTTSRNLETVRIEGLPSGSSCPTDPSTYTPAAGNSVRKISTQWHVSYRLPTQIDEAGRRTAFSYDVSGNLLQKTVTDTA